MWVCSSRALSRLHALFCVRIPALVSWVSVSCRGSDTRSMFCHLVWACGLECARVVRSLVWVFCFVLERGVRIPALVSWVSVSCRGSDTRSVFCLVVWVCGLECARVMQSLVWGFCFVLERGVRIPALVSWVSVSCRGSDTRAPCSVLLCECAVWSVRSRLRALFCVRIPALVSWVPVSCRGSDTRSVFCLVVWVCGLECARVMQSLVWVFCFVLERGVRIPALVSWVSVSCRGSDIRSVFCLVVWVCGLECARPCALLSMQFVFYRCDCYQFTIAVTLCRVLSCPAKPCCQSSFPYGVFCLFVLEIKPITLQYWVLASSLYPNPDMWVCYYFHDDAK